MQFFEEQSRAKSRTLRLLVLFTIAVIGIVASVDLLVWGLLNLRHNWNTATALQNPRASVSLFDQSLPILAIATVATLALIFISSLYKFYQLRGGGGASVALQMGGKLLSAQSPKAADRTLLNVVEEMSIASGVPMPQVYVMEDEAGINAFAAGHSPTDAVIGITRGAIDQLSRDELQGVIGHEFSHILNGDMRLNLRLIGFLNGILVLSIIGAGILRGLTSMRYSSSSNRRSSGAMGILFIVALGVGLYLIGSVGLILGQIIQAAVSRQREYLADASSVQFTRNPKGLVGALTKIAGFSHSSRIDNAHSLEMSHMMFAGIKAGWLSSLMASHPPIDERIRRLDPNYVTNMPTLPPVGSAPSRPRIPTMAAQIVDRVGNPQVRDLQRATALISDIPADIRAQTGDLFGARAVICSLLVSREQPMRGQQLAMIDLADAPLANQTRKLRLSVQELGDAHRLPLIDLCIPTLRQMSLNQQAEFRKLLNDLILADRTLMLFELTLYHIVTLSILPPEQRRPNPDAIAALQPLSDDIAITISALALSGPRSPEIAYQSSMSRLPLRPMPRLIERIDIKKLNESMQNLARATPGVKKRILETAAWCVVEDRSISIMEAELLRALAAILNCPLPAMVTGR